MKKLIPLVIAALFTLKAAAQDEKIPFKNLPQNVKKIIAADLNQYAATIATRIDDWLQDPDYDDSRHQILKGRADTYAYYLYCLNGKLMIEAIEKYGGAIVASAASVDFGGASDMYGTTVLFKCGNHHGAHSTSSVNGEADLRKKYGCTGFYFQAL